MKLQMKINPETQVIEEAKFKTFGCGSAIASSSLATEWVKGKTVEEALSIKNTDIVRELSLPPVKIHCSCSPKTPSRPPSATGRRSTASKCRLPRRLRTERDPLQGQLDMATEVASPNIAKIHLTEHAGRKSACCSKRKAFRSNRAACASGVQGGGCSGLSYAMRIDTQARDRDKGFRKSMARASSSTQKFPVLERHHP